MLDVDEPAPRTTTWSSRLGELAINFMKRQGLTGHTSAGSDNVAAYWRKKETRGRRGYVTNKRVTGEDTVYQTSDEKIRFCSVMVRLGACEAMSERGQDMALMSLAVCCWSWGSREERNC